MLLKKNQSGFTLVELLIVVGIVAILAAFAYPSYINYIQRARMEAARAEMTDNIRLMEQHYAKNRTMCATKNADNTCASMPAPAENIAADFYDTTIESDPMNQDASSYIILSIPNNKANYSTNTLNKKQLYMLYYSNGSGYVKCTKAGFDKVKSQTDATGDSTGCSVM